MTDAEQIAKVRAKRDPVFATMMRRIAGRTSNPAFTKEATIRHYSQAAGVPVSRKSVRNVVLFLSEIGVCEFVQNPEQRISGISWRVDAINFSRKVIGLQWSPSDDEIRAFMEGL